MIITYIDIGTFVFTIFAAPTATILGGPDFYVQKGSTINLTCSIRLGPEESQIFIFWYHKEEVHSIAILIFFLHNFHISNIYITLY